MIRQEIVKIRIFFSNFCIGYIISLPNINVNSYYFSYADDSVLFFLYKLDWYIIKIEKKNMHSDFELTPYVH